MFTPGEYVIETRACVWMGLTALTEQGFEIAALLPDGATHPVIVPEHQLRRIGALSLPREVEGNGEAVSETTIRLPAIEVRWTPRDESEETATQRSPWWSLKRWVGR